MQYIFNQKNEHIFEDSEINGESFSLPLYLKEMSKQVPLTKEIEQITFKKIDESNMLLNNYLFTANGIGLGFLIENLSLRGTELKVGVGSSCVSFAIKESDYSPIDSMQLKRNLIDYFGNGYEEKSFEEKIALIKMLSKTIRFETWFLNFLFQMFGAVEELETIFFTTNTDENVIKELLESAKQKIAQINSNKENVRERLSLRIKQAPFQEKTEYFMLFIDRFVAFVEKAISAKEENAFCVKDEIENSEALNSVDSFVDVQHADENVDSEESNKVENRNVLTALEIFYLNQVETISYSREELSLLRSLLTDKELSLKNAKTNLAIMLKYKEFLVKNNQKLVYKMALYYKKIPSIKLSTLDLIQYGNMGLIRGIDRFVYQKDLKLSTYISFWIRQSINENISAVNRLIYVPIKLVNKVLSEDSLSLSAEKQQKTSYLKGVIEDPLSLNICIADDNSYDENDCELADSIGDENNCHAYVEHLESLDFVKEIMVKSLNEQEYFVISRRFGFHEHEEMSLKEIGRVTGNLSHERVRQIQNSALGKLKLAFKENGISDSAFVQYCS